MRGHEALSRRRQGFEFPWGYHRSTVPKIGHERIAKPTLADYLAVMSRAVFQAGLSWAQIDRQWDSLCTAFDDFDPRKVARYRARDIKRIMATPGILHSE